MIALGAAPYLPVNHCCAMIYMVAGLGQHSTRTKSWPNNGPTPWAPNRFESDLSPSLSLTLCTLVSDKLACVSYVSDNTEAQS